MNQKNENYWLLDAPVTKAIWHMAIPMMLGMSINIIYNITDTFFIGRLNDTAALAAISLLLPFTTILMAIGNLFGTGGSTLFSRLLGSENTDRTKQCSATTLWLSFLFGLLTAIISIIFSNYIIRLLGADSNTFVYVKQYLIFYGMGAPFIIANFTLEQLIRGDGKSVESMIGMMISIGANIILDPILMFGLQLGIRGAAIATVIGNAFAVIYYIVCIQRADNQLSALPKYFRLEKQMLKEIFLVGLSAMLLDILLIVSSLMFNYYALKYGDYVLAGFGISQKLVQIVDLIGMGLYMGVIPLIAVAYGARNELRMKEIIKKTALYLALVITCLFAILFTCRNFIVHCFSNDSDVIRIGAYILTVQLCSSFFAAGAGLLTGIFQAKGEGTPAVVMSVMRGFMLIPAIIFGNYLFKMNGVIFSLLVAEAISCITGLVLYKLKK
ncbi:TPA: MATE family efflux transporter [Clostridioides difficile]|uniref:MATE family efflux transporter n=1 Tax=Clostridioides difficile TaxID=1496 RepID=UPI00097FF4D7|nr:MATE family efflux transporter [Clostridioides difficile]SJQ35550.1 Staphylococcal virulence regulator protein A [Clostridioides difficile]HBF0727312.1 MATE family efflux transporter [Clostridioides difficile]HBF6039021.1 MATE family efflux transporter [Clostridioides difficile]HBF7387286.1 MATE family efflux transporter [Clostridioides difficile]HBG3351394.1 MATE family efflux transporter [Clostridioides difficile]